MHCHARTNISSLNIPWSYKLSVSHFLGINPKFNARKKPCSKVFVNTLNWMENHFVLAKFRIGVQIFRSISHVKSTFLFNTKKYENYKVQSCYTKIFLSENLLKSNKLLDVWNPIAFSQPESQSGWKKITNLKLSSYFLYFDFMQLFPV